MAHTTRGLLVPLVSPKEQYQHKMANEDNDKDCHYYSYYLGIDIGTQGLTCLLTDADLHVVATGEASYGFVPNSPAGVYEQYTTDWQAALRTATEQVHQQFVAKHNSNALKIAAIGISGQMHGEVLLTKAGKVLEPVRLWCDGRNAETAAQLTQALQTKCPQRMTAVRFLWTAQHQPDRAAATHRFTTPAGWLAYSLTGKVVLGIGDAAGMFPVVGDAYNAEKMAIYNDLLHQHASCKDKNIQDMLPDICVAGQDAGSVTVAGAQLLAGLLGPNSTNADLVAASLVGIPVASAEGDQVAALAGSLVGKAGTAACSFGTSVCANVVADLHKPRFQGVHAAIDHFCAADGQPIHSKLSVALLTD